jgi:hypothetical protein
MTTAQAIFADCAAQFQRLAWYRGVAQRYLAAFNTGNIDAVLALDRAARYFGQLRAGPGARRQ